MKTRKTPHDFGVTIRKLRTFLKNLPADTVLAPNDPNGCAIAELVKHENPDLDPQYIGITDSYVRYGLRSWENQVYAWFKEGSWAERFQNRLSDAGDYVNPAQALRVLNDTIRGRS